MPTDEMTVPALFAVSDTEGKNNYSVYYESRELMLPIWFQPSLAAIASASRFWI
jgi:hypothetical protein